MASPASSRRWAMLARAAGSGSLGCQQRVANRCAKCMTCSPLPLASSRTLPLDGKSCARTVAIGSRLRGKEGEERRLSGGKRLASLTCPDGSPGRLRCVGAE